MTEQQRLQFDTPAGNPISVYIASSLTCLSDEEDLIVKRVSGAIAEFCSESGMLIHQPALHTHPIDHESLSPAEVHNADFRKVVESDVIIAIGDFPSWGAGKEVAWAERMRTPLLMFLRDGQDVSRLVRGTPGDFEVATWREFEDIRDKCSAYFLKRVEQFEMQRRLRADRRHLWSPALTAICIAYDELDELGRARAEAVARLSDRRVREIISSPLTLAHASLDEALALVNALGLPSSTLFPTGSQSAMSSKGLSALATASELQAWSGDQAIKLLQEASIELARGGTRRLAFNEAADWIAFKND